MLILPIRDISTARSDIDEQLRATETQQHETQQRIFHLKSARNALTPASNLPPELLSLIFVHYIYDPQLRFHTRKLPADNRASPFNIRWLDIMRVTSVCRTWRSAALKCREFWSQIVFGRSLWTARTMLDRARGSPLCIRAHDPTPHNSFLMTIPLVDIGLERVQELSLCLNLRHLQQTFQGTSGRRAEQLQSLYICEQGLSNQWTNHYGSDPFAIRMPNLRQLETINYSISWPSLSAACHSIFPRLVSLRITLGNHCGLFGRREVYEVLSALPGLEVLEFVNVLQEGSLGCVESIKKSILPYLSSCTIQDSSLSLCAEFHKYVFYRTTTAKLRFGLLTGKEVTVSDVPAESLHSLLNTWGLSQDNPKRSCTRLFLTPRDDYHEAFRVIIWDGPGYPKKCPSLRSYPRSHHNYPDPAAVLDLIIESRGLALIRNLVVLGLRWVGIEQTTQLSFGEKDWFSFFKRHSGISHVSVTSPSVREVLRALSTPLDGKNDDCSSSPVSPSGRVGHPKLCLPHLSVLALDPAIGCHRKTDIDDEVQEVKKFLMERRRHGLPLHRLSLGEILYKPEIMALFYDLVVEVTQHSGLIDDLPPLEHNWYGSHLVLDKTRNLTNTTCVCPQNVDEMASSPDRDIYRFHLLHEFTIQAGPFPYCSCDA